MMRERLDAVWAFVCGIDPGTMRSLIWVCLSAAGLDRGDSWITEASLVASFALGLASAAMPPRPRP